MEMMEGNLKKRKTGRIRYRTFLLQNLDFKNLVLRHSIDILSKEIYFWPEISIVLKQPSTFSRSISPLKKRCFILLMNLVLIRSLKRNSYFDEMKKWKLRGGWKRKNNNYFFPPGALPFPLHSWIQKICIKPSHPFLAIQFSCFSLTKMKLYLSFDAISSSKETFYDIYFESILFVATFNSTNGIVWWISSMRYCAGNTWGKKEYWGQVWAILKTFPLSTGIKEWGEKLNGKIEGRKKKNITSCLSVLTAFHLFRR